MSAHGDSDAEDEKIPSRAADETKPHDDDEAARRKAKARVILDACQRRDLDALRDLAISEGGFLSDSLRQRACESTGGGIGMGLLLCLQPTNLLLKGLFFSVPLRPQTTLDWRRLSHGTACLATETRTRCASMSTGASSTTPTVCATATP